MRNTWFSRVFIGPHGLRSGWGLLIYIFILAVCLFTTNIFANAFPAFVAARKHAHAAMLGIEAMRPGSLLILYGTSLTLVLLVSWIMSRIERRRPGGYGLGGSHSIRNFVKGLLSGLVL